MIFFMVMSPLFLRAPVVVLAGTNLRATTPACKSLGVNNINNINDVILPQCGGDVPRTSLQFGGEIAKC
jgi:hypothetical protein